jgi:hypothetical protein
MSYEPTVVASAQPAKCDFRLLAFVTVLLAHEI